MTVDLILRGTGSRRSPGEHLAVLQGEVETDRVILYGPDAASAAGTEFESARDAGALRRLLDGQESEPVLVFGGEQVLSVVQQWPVGTVWIALGKGANPVREVWRLRGAHAWLGAKRLGLILEESDGTGLDRSTSLAMGRVAKVIPLPPTPESAVMQEAAAARLGAPDDAEWLGEATETTPEAAWDETEGVAAEVPGEVSADQPEALPEGVPEEMAAETPSRETVEIEGGDQAMGEDRMAHGTMLMGDHNAEQALLTRYSLVKERRNLLTKMEAVEETLHALLKELFATRFMLDAENAASFEDLTRKLADTAADYRELARELERVESDLEQLSWLKGELEM
jgi:hypothetical protein